jgi:hypothetical protein
MAELKGAGRFKFADVRNTLATSPLGVFSSVPRVSEPGFSIARSLDGRCRVQSAAGVETSAPELAVFDPSDQIRLAGINCLNERAFPCWPSVKYWQSLAEKRPFTDQEFARMLEDLQGVAEPVLAGIAEKMSGGKFDVHDVIPSSKTYYESLLGPMPSCGNVDGYIQDVLLPHLREIFRRSTIWGLRCIRATCIADIIDPTLAAREVSNDDLFQAIQQGGDGNVPSARVATCHLALSREGQDPRFALISQQTFDCILQRSSSQGSSDGHDVLLAAWVRLTLAVIGLSEEMASVHPFWKRLAAFSHAALLMDAVQLTDTTAKSIADWCETKLSQESAFVEIIDHLNEPRWLIDELDGQDLWIDALLRTVHLSSQFSSSLGILTEAQGTKVHLNILKIAGAPSPIHGARLDLSGQGVEMVGVEILDGVELEDEDGNFLMPLPIWAALAHRARIYAFHSDLLSRIHDLASDLRPQVLTEFSGAHASLVLCCNIAATQGDSKLAGLVAELVIEASEEFSSASDAALAASILVLAASAAESPPSRFQWAADQLLALAYRLPRGACCDGLAQTIEAFQRLIPYHQRKWGKAAIVAKSAI